jgi:TonB family protein
MFLIMNNRKGIITRIIRLHVLTSRLFLTLIAAFTLHSLCAQELIPSQPYGGAYQLKDFIKQEMVYPATALENKVEGDVDLIIYTDESGQVISLKVQHPVSPEIDSEAVRIMKKVLWQPAKYMGKTIPDSQVVTIKFNIKKYNRYCMDRGYTTLNYPHEPVDESNIIYGFKEVDTVPKLVFTDQTMTLGKYINEQIQYPEAAMKYSITGKETITFVVESNGHISNVQPKDYIGAGCWEESVRLVKLLKWHPGINDNKAVRVSMSISITFNLTNKAGIHYVPIQLNNSMQ